MFLRPSEQEILNRARACFAQQDYRSAEELIRRILDRSPQSPPALLLGARCAIKLNQLEQASGYINRIEVVDGPSAAAILCEAGELLLIELHRASAAEERFRRVLEIEPDNFIAVNRLAYLLTVEGRVWESLPFLMQQVRMGRFTADHLLLLGTGDAFVEGPKTTDTFRRAVPDDPVPLIGLARTAINENRNRDAESSLRAVVSKVPHLIEAQALLGRVLVESRNVDALHEWHQGLPEEAEQHPMIWLVRGLWAQQRGEDKPAVRCFGESIRLAPNQKLPNYKLGQALAALGERGMAAPFLERARELEQVVATIGQIHDRRTDTHLMRRVSKQMEGLGRVWEAWGWARIALSVNPQLLWAQETVARLQPQLTRETPWTIPEALPGQNVDWSDYSLPNWTSMAPASKRIASSAAASRSRASFVDSAAAAGLRFKYFASEDTHSEGKRIFEQNGGGAAVLDYDADGWPDIYLSQGCPWPPNPEQDRHLDALFWNEDGARFVDVASRAGLAENRYSQGVTVGDFDNDGFADLYVANIGKNRFFRNNGDGTFTDIADQTGTAGDRWTTSCLLADLNGDGLPDLYAVNYVTGHDVFTRICIAEGGQPRMCSPKAFQASQDQLYLNLGDGRFKDVTNTAGIAVPDGKGLGILAADFDGDGLLSLFIANDQCPNFFFRNRTQSRGQRLSFEEDGLASGLAYDWDGLALACMGVAAGDADANGLLDLFVTNFAGEPNVLYLQQPGCFFVDSSREAGLRNSSFMQLGFGTQFLDGELDGRLDLLLANGHVDDFTFRGQEHEMHPQYYRNAGGGRFVEVPATALGDYFQGRYLGRAMARLDWNRDGREEAVISHIDVPVALLANSTEPAGRFLAVRLVGVSSSRDAIGTTVIAETAGGRLMHQLTAGDGYQASNERRLVFGLGDADRVDCLKVHWPGGLKQRFERLSANAEWMLIEGQTEPAEMRK